MRSTGSAAVLLPAPALHAAAALGIPASLAHKQTTTQDLALATGTSVAHLARLMRTLRVARVVGATTQGRWGLTRLGTFLAPDTHGSLHAAAMQLREAARPGRWIDLAETVRAGRCLFTETYGEPFFMYLAHHPEQAAKFDTGMTAATAGHVEALIAGYPFQNHPIILDVGGGEGLLLQSIKSRFHKVECILFELPYVIQRVRQLGPKSVILIAGDVLVDALPQADAIILKAVLHDWDDAEALHILQSCRAALKPGGVVMVVELRNYDWRESSPAVFNDLTLMALTGGRERTWREFDRLYAKANLKPAPHANYFAPDIRPLKLDVLVSSRTR